MFLVQKLNISICTYLNVKRLNITCSKFYNNLIVI